MALISIQYVKNLICLKFNLLTTNEVLKMYMLFVLLSSQTITTIDACGPGRGIGRHRHLRKLTPLVYKQHEPNHDEYSNLASGLTTGFIERNTSKFDALISNYNRDIQFRDDEGSGADRVMTLVFLFLVFFVILLYIIFVQFKIAFEYHRII